MTLRILLLLAALHIGSPDAWFVGTAGPYPVQVLVRTPGVIPGLADVVVTVTGDSVFRVTASPAAYNAGERGVPPPDEARPVPGRPGTWSVPLWIMASGSYSVRVTVRGAKGEGTAMVPVSAVATRVLAMDPRLGGVLAVLGIVLLGGAISIIGAANRESVLAPGEVPDRRMRRRGRVSMVVGVVILASATVGGRAWWRAVDAEYRGSLDRRWEASAAILTRNGSSVLQLAIPDSAWRGRSWRDRAASPLIPDHGKLMHLFLVGEHLPDAFAHLHPVVAADSSIFETVVPVLPAGRYRVFADITHESGFARTLTASVDLPGSGASVSPDPDDAWVVAAATDSVALLPDSTVIRWQRPPRLAANEDAGLRFEVLHRGGLATLEPYLGMAGHAVVMKEDGSVYIHLHPMGTVSAAAIVALAQRQPGDTVRGTLGRRLTDSDTATTHGLHGVTYPGQLAFPYAFPAPGAYRIWVQFRLGGRIETAAFRAVVQ